MGTLTNSSNINDIIYELNRSISDYNTTDDHFQCINTAKEAAIWKCRHRHLGIGFGIRFGIGIAIRI